ncbi:MAG: peptide deformylase [Desulfovibrio sp.]|jgi:peptide deformylase|nr:peptide deformylase [Desulfovibrio sp.]
MVLDLVTYPDPRLKQTSAPIEEMTDELRTLAADMKETMVAKRGVGLAAPQVGRFVRMLVVSLSETSDSEIPPQEYVLVNPVLTLGGEEKCSKAEGCLSVPMNFRADVMRKDLVTLDALDLEGRPIHMDFHGYPAFVLQHECDHLDGVLFLDRISRIRRTLYDGRLKKWLARKDGA